MLIKRLKKTIFGDERRKKILRRFPSLSLERDVQFKGNIDNFDIGRNGQIQNHVVMHLGGLSWCDYKGKIKIGDNAIISPQCIFYGAGTGGITIGDNFSCGPGTFIFSSRQQFKNKPNHFKAVSIGNNVVLGSRVTISEGVTIGDGAVIGAHSLVTKDIPSYTFYAGIPAEFKYNIEGNNLA